MVKKAQITKKDRQRIEYAEGDVAFSNFVDVDDCPYDSAFMGSKNPQGLERTSWMAGWYDTKYKAKFPKLFDKGHPEYLPDPKGTEE